MQDTNGNGKVDRLVVTFNATLAASNYIAQWTLTNVPSGGTKSSVSTSGNTATVVITEGVGAADTSVGSFTVALAASATGIRTTGGVQASFAATAPTDGAKPVPTAATLNNAVTSGTVVAGDFISITYSEALDPSTICAGWSDQVNPSSTTATVTISNSGAEPITFGAPCTNIGVVDTNANYVSTNPRTFAGSAILWTPSTKTLKITLAGGSGGTANGGNGLASATYTPGTALADIVGNTSAGSSFGGASSRF